MQCSIIRGGDIPFLRRKGVAIISAVTVQHHSTACDTTILNILLASDALFVVQCLHYLQERP